MGLLPAGAVAAQTHLFQFAFNGEGEAPQALAQPLGLAVDNSGTASNGRVYVADSSIGAVDVFDPAGEYSETVQGSFSFPWAVAVDQSNGDFYVLNLAFESKTGGFIDKFDSAGKVVKSFGAEGRLTGAATPLGKLRDPDAIAVDPKTGDLYVIASVISQATSEVIDVFNSSGQYLRQFPSDRNAFSDAIDSQGNLFVSGPTGTKVYDAATGQLNPAYGQGTGLLDPSEARAVAVDPANDDVYVFDRINDAFKHTERVVQYGSNGAVISKFGSGPLAGSSSRAIAVGDGESHIYVAETESGKVAVFDRALVPLPTPITAEATDLAVTSATLNGTVNPEGIAVSECFFEYGETEAYGGTVACEPDAASVGAGTAPVAVHADITGLSPSTVYHYRLVAADENGSEHGVDRIFGEPPHVDATSVADVTSGAADLQAQIDPSGVAATYHFEYSTDPGFADATGTPDAEVPSSPVGSARGETVAGSNHVAGITEVSGTFPIGAIVVGPGVPVGTTVVSFSPNKGLRLSAPVTSGAQNIALTVPPAVSQSISGLTPETTYYYRAVATNSAAPGGVVGPTKALVTHSTSLDAALPDERVYELVSPSVKATGGGVFDFFFAALQTQLAHPGWAIQATESGSAVIYPGEGFFESPGVPAGSVDHYTSFRGPDGWSTHNTSGEEPEEAFAPLSPPAVPPAPVLPPSATSAAQVQEVTPDGSLVFFTDTGKLTSDSTVGPGEPDLYRYDTETEQLTDLSVDPNSGQHADVQGVLGVGGEGAAAGSYVYFVANGVLGDGAAKGVQPGNCTGKTAEPMTDTCNLYLLQGTTTSFIATLSAQESYESGLPAFGTETTLELHDWTAQRSLRTAEVSPDGRYLAFGGLGEITAQPAAGPQVFRYDSQTRSLLCASCNPDGSTSPTAFFLHPLGAGGSRQHYIANDGRLFFNDLGALSSRDVNGRVDVYEFEDSGTGTCATPRGCRSLISGGGGTGDSYLAAVSDEGNDVFFTSNQRLSSEDRDESLDMYDARVDGRTPPVPPLPCETAEGCHGPIPRPPAEQTPGTPGFHGPPNPVEKPCKKGFVKKAVKCVKKTSKHHGHKKNHKRAASHNGGGGK